MADRLSPWIRRGVIPGVLLLALLVLAVAAELALRAIGLGTPLLYRANLLYGYELIENQQEQRRRGAKVTINQVGLRSERPWRGSPRVLFAGDSITYGGSYIDDAQVFPAIACAKLRASGWPEAACGNAGTNAYGVRNVLRRLEYGPVQDADVIVITLFYADFLRGLAELGSQPFFSRRPTGFFRASTELAAFVSDLVRSRLRWGLPLERSTLAEDESLELDFALTELTRVATELQARGRIVLLVWSPTRAWVNGARPLIEQAVFERVHERLATFGTLDMTLELPRETEGLFYDTAHLEVPGHALYGEVLAEAIGARLLER